MNKPFDLIIFDWDGTLIDTIPWIVHCLQTAAIACGYPTPEVQAAKDVIGLSIQRAVDTLFPDADTETQGRLVASYSQTYLSKQLSADDLFTGVYDMLITLKQAGYQLAVATGKTRHGLNQALTATGTTGLFCTTRCADETASKPHPRMLNEIIAHVGIPSKRALMVGDSIHDMQMAANAQMPAVGVSCGAHPTELLQQYAPWLCLTQPTELLNFI